MPVTRWVFDDLNGETWEIPRNPQRMDPVTRERNITALGTTAVDGRDLLFEGPSAPRQWSFAGKIHNQAHYDGLYRWVYDKIQVIRITDHLSRKLRVVLRSLDAENQNKFGASGAYQPWYHTYTVQGLFLRIDP